MKFRKLNINVMKKTILMLAVGFGTLCLTSCSRGYGCPYGVETEFQKVNDKLIKKSDAELLERDIEFTECEVIAD